MSPMPPLGDLVRRYDPDRFFTSLFAPAGARESLWALYAFNHELARAREAVREPMMALIRLQWWREVVEGARRRHEVAEPVGAALDRGALEGADLLALIEAREADPPEDGAAWVEYVESTAGRLAAAAGRVLGSLPNPALAAAGAAYGASGVLRNRGLAGDSGIPELAAAGRRWLDQAATARFSRSHVAAALPAVFARRDLARRMPVRDRGLGDKLAVMRAALTGLV